MSHTTHGRHRAAPPHSPIPGGIATWALIVAVVIAIGAVALLWPDAATAPGVAEPTPPSGTPAPTPTASPTLGTPTATIESSRDVTVEGDTVTVDEVSDLVDGDTAIAHPTDVAPLGLRLVDSAVVTSDGRTEAFDTPITLTASGSLTVRNRYRLTDCPDVLPAQWPSTTDFPDATRTYLRLDEPLHTAYALCPGAPSGARPLPQLSGLLVGGDGVLVRLRWQGTGDLTIQAVGSASGVAALAIDSPCGASCVATLTSGGSAVVQIQPADPCPPATTDDNLTLTVAAPDEPALIVSVLVPALHVAVCN